MRRNHMSMWPMKSAPCAINRSPPDKLVQIQQRERQRADAQAKQLRDEFAKEKAAALAKARAQIEQVRKDAATAAEQAKQESEQARGGRSGRG